MPEGAHAELRRLCAHLGVVSHDAPVFIEERFRRPRHCLQGGCNQQGSALPLFRYKSTSLKSPGFNVPIIVWTLTSTSASILYSSRLRSPMSGKPEAPVQHLRRQPA